MCLPLRFHQWHRLVDSSRLPKQHLRIVELQPFQGQLYLGYDNGQLGYMDSSNTWNSILTVSDSIISMVAAGNVMLYFGTGLGAVGDVESGARTGMFTPTQGMDQRTLHWSLVRWPKVSSACTTRPRLCTSHRQQALPPRDVLADRSALQMRLSL